MTIDEAMQTLTGIFIVSCMGAPDKETEEKFNRALQIAHECMERCKRIDEAEFRDTDIYLAWDEEGYMHSRGWNDCLEWAKEREEKWKRL